MFSFKSRLYIIVIITITFFACKKEDVKDDITRENYYGTYLGEDTNSWGNWSLKHISITEAPFGEEFVFINRLVRHADHQITATVDKDHISFKDQKFHVDNTSPGGAHTVYDAHYFGSGTLDTNSHKLIIHYTEKQIFEDTTFTIQWICTTVKDSI